MLSKLARKTNNPFNVRYNPRNKWLGQCGHVDGFCRFSSLQYGLRTGLKLISNYMRLKNLRTIREIIERFAPSSENDTEAYIDYVCSVVHIPEDFPLCTTEVVYLLCRSICKFESGYELTHSEFSFITSQYGIRFF